MTAINKITLNVGLNPSARFGEIKTPLNIFGRSIAAVAVLLHATSIRAEQQPSATEQTAVIELYTPFDLGYTEEQITKVCNLLAQDCIAFRFNDDAGHLVGPFAESWGAFNSEYFLTPSWASPYTADGVEHAPCYFDNDRNQPIKQDWDARTPNTGRRPSDSELGYVL